MSVVRPTFRKLFTFSWISSQEPQGQFQPNLAQSILVERDRIEYTCTLKKCKKVYKTTKLNSTKRCTTLFWLHEFQITSRFISTRDNYEIAKIHWQTLNCSFPDPRASFNQTWHKASLGEGGFKVLQIRSILFLKKIFFSANQRYDIIICTLWFELVSRVSDVTHEPLVTQIS